MMVYFLGDLGWYSLGLASQYDEVRHVDPPVPSPTMNSYTFESIQITGEVVSDFPPILGNITIEKLHYSQITKYMGF
jgi:hypothetical protein